MSKGKVHLVSGSEIHSVEMNKDLMSEFLSLFYEKISEENRVFMIKRLKLEPGKTSFAKLILKMNKGLKKKKAPLSNYDICRMLTASNTCQGSTGYVAQRPQECGMIADINYHGEYQ